MESLFDGPHFHEAGIRLNRPVKPVLDALAAQGVIGGYDLSGEFPALGNALLVCATETKTRTDLETYASALGTIMRSRKRRSA